MKTIKKLTLSAVMVAMSVVLAFVSKVIPALPNGGQITLASMVPVVLISFFLGTKYGLLTSITYAILQLVMGFYPPPVRNLISFIAVIFLDYIIAFGCLGLAGKFADLFGNSKYRYTIATAIVVTIRYICHIISGILIWGVYAPNQESIWLYSVTYNGSYMIPEIIISSVVVYLITYKSNIKSLFVKDRKQS